MCGKYTVNGLLKLREPLQVNGKTIQLICFSCIRDYHITVSLYWKFIIYPELLENESKQEKELFFF